MSGSNPPSTSGSPSLARRALLTGAAALSAIAGPAVLVAATAGGEPSAARAEDTSSTSFLATELHLVRSLTAGSAITFQDRSAEATTAAPAPAPVRAVRSAAPAPAPVPAATPTPEPAPAPAPTPAPAPSGAGDPNDPASWDRLAGCESGGNWAINTGNGYYGGLQFSLGSWRAVGGAGYPHEASRETQIEMGKRLHASGGWRHWPGCTRKFGWR